MLFLDPTNRMSDDSLQATKNRDQKKPSGVLQPRPEDGYSPGQSQGGTDNVEDMNAIPVIMIAAGALVLIVSMYTSRHLQEAVPPSFKPSWVLLASSIGCFVFGSCGYLLLRPTAFSVPLDLLTGALFFGGAVFIYCVMSLTSHTLHAAKDLHDNLAAQVEQRTLQLNGLNQFLDSVINAFPHPFYVIDVRTHEIVLANKNARIAPSGSQMTCPLLADGLTQSCRDGGHPCLITEIRKSGSAVVVERVHLNADGQKEIVEVHGSPIYDQTGELIQIIEYYVDVTDKKQTEQTRQTESCDPTPAAADATMQVFQYIKTATELADDQVARLMAIARENMVEILAEASKALKENNPSALGHQAHKLKGILLQCGFTEMAEKAQQIHTRVNAPQSFASGAALDEIRKGISEFLKGL